MPKLTAVTPDRFATQAWSRADYAFARQDHLIPVVVAELTQLVPMMPLVFTKAGERYQLMGLTSALPGANLFISPEGQWLGDYTPAALRAYPFHLIKPADRDDSVLCIDVDSGRLVEAGQGEAFFNPDGTPSPAINGILQLLSEIESSRIATQAAVAALNAAGLIQPWNLSVRDGEQTLTIEGLHRIDETRLNALTDETFLALRHNGALFLAISQLLSLNQMTQFQKLVQVHRQLRLQIPAEPRVTNDFSIDFTDNGTLKFH